MRVSVSASDRSSRFALSVAPTFGVRGSPVRTGMSMTLPRCTPSAGRMPPFG